MLHTVKFVLYQEHITRDLASMLVRLGIWKFSIYIVYFDGKCNLLSVLLKTWILSRKRSLSYWQTSKQLSLYYTRLPDYSKVVIDLCIERWSKKGIELNWKWSCRNNNLGVATNRHTIIVHITVWLSSLRRKVKEYGWRVIARRRWIITAPREYYSEIWIRPYTNVGRYLICNLIWINRKRLRAA